MPGNGSVADQKTPMVPAGSDHASKVCHLCQEPISIVWDDEADEWMYQNATFHTTEDGSSKEVSGSSHWIGTLMDLTRHLSIDHTCLVCRQVAAGRQRTIQPI